MYEIHEKRAMLTEIYTLSVLIQIQLSSPLLSATAFSSLTLLLPFFSSKLFSHIFPAHLVQSRTQTKNKYSQNAHMHKNPHSFKKNRNRNLHEMQLNRCKLKWKQNSVWTFFHDVWLCCWFGCLRAMMMCNWFWSAIFSFLQIKF